MTPAQSAELAALCTAMKNAVKLVYGDKPDPAIVIDAAFNTIADALTGVGRDNLEALLREMVSRTSESIALLRPTDGT